MLPTPLMITCSNGNAKLTKFLLENKYRKAKPNKKVRGKTAFTCACDSNSIECIKLLIKNKISLNQRVGNNNIPTLSYACQSNKEKIVSLILNHKVDVNKSIGMNWKDENNSLNEVYMQPIHYAALNGNQKIVSKLIKKGANPCALTYQDIQPIHFAAKSGSLELVKYLVNKMKIDITAKTFDNKTPLDFALESKNSQMIEFIINNIPINQKNEILDQIFNEKDDDTLALLLDSIPNSVNSLFLYSFKYVGVPQKENIFKVFLNNPNVDINLQNNDGDCLLHFACREKSAKLIKIIKKNMKTQSFIKNKKGETALDIVIDNNWEEGMNLLLR